MEMTERPVLIFDMDGVLVDVTASYRETIRLTVRHFTGREITNDLIQEYKNAGGWNNDWALSQKICADLGTEVEYEVVIREFQRIFFGENRDGLILRERWIAAEGLLERLSGKYELAIFTGRLRFEAAFTLERFVPALRWAAIVADDDVANSKPAPDGLFAIAHLYPGRPLWYVGDTVDDARASKAAGVPFIGIAHSSNPKHAELAALLQQEGAVAVLDNINELETVL